MYFFLSRTTPSFADTNCDGQPFSCYVQKYSFDNSQGSNTVPADVLKRLQDFAPHVGKAVAAYNKRFNQTIEPQLVMWWTYSEGITAHINWSNCANESYDYATNLKNCDSPSFWQLGPAGIQFGFIGYFYGAGSQSDRATPMIKLAFQDMHGDPNNANLVQQVGQAVLDYDKSLNVTPSCGGPSCTFPAMTIDQLTANVYNSHPPFDNSGNRSNNWWASVLVRDPDISAYIQARGLWRVKSCVGIGDPNYCIPSVWQRESAAMATIVNLNLNYNANVSSGNVILTAHSNCVMTKVGNPATLTPNQIQRYFNNGHFVLEEQICIYYIGLEEGGAGMHPPAQSKVDAGFAAAQQMHETVLEAWI